MKRRILRTPETSRAINGSVSLSCFKTVKFKIQNMTTVEILTTKLKETVEGTVETQGMWSVPFSSCKMNLGRVELPDGRIGLAYIKVEADEDEIEYEADNFEELPMLKIL